MSRVVELVRQSALPANLMRSAARGALSLSPVETLEALVCLARNPVFADDAQLTLAAWDDAATISVLSSPGAPKAVLEYFSAPRNLRPRLLPAMLENPSLSTTRLLELVRSSPRESLPVMAASQRVRQEATILYALMQRPELDELEKYKLDTRLRELLCSEAGGTESESSVIELDLAKFFFEHAGEIAAEENTPFSLVDLSDEEKAQIHAVIGCHPPTASTSVAALALQAADRAEMDRLTPVQKIAKLNVGERVQLAYRGNRDERFILIRDAARIVSAAVLESPKVNEAEAETYASMRNVGEHVLRIIAAKRRFIRHYAIKRVLASNPKCPTEVALPLIKQLLLPDLRRLLMNKDINDNVRHFTFKVWRMKQAARK